MTLVTGVQEFLSGCFANLFAQRQDTVNRSINLRRSSISLRDQAGNRAAVAGDNDGGPLLDVIE